MDPEATWTELLDAWVRADWESVEISARDLKTWLNGGGFPPDVCRGRKMGAIWNRAMALAGCDLAIETVDKVRGAPDGIPPDVPFVLSCVDCDAEGPGSYDEAITEGWTSIRFFPNSLAENFLGYCPDHNDG